MRNLAQVMTLLANKLNGNGFPVTESALFDALCMIRVADSGQPFSYEHPFGLNEAISLEELAYAYTINDGNIRGVREHFNGDYPVSKATVLIAVLLRDVFRRYRDQARSLQLVA